MKYLEKVARAAADVALRGREELLASFAIPHVVSIDAIIVSHRLDHWQVLLDDDLVDIGQDIATFDYFPCKMF